MSRAPFVIHEYVRWGDVDYAGIIRYDAYTRFMELAESELFRSLGISYREFVDRFDFGIPRRAMHIDFESPPTLDERLEVVAYISRVGSTSLTLNFDFFGDGDALRASGYLVLVCVERGAMRARAWPGDFLQRIEKYCMTQDDARAARGAPA
ncbi:MAG: acyl-CoA thioesterase [Gemmatimonadaceae bacterium]